MTCMNMCAHACVRICTSVFSRENIEERSPANTVAMTPNMLRSRMVSYTRDIRPCMCAVRAMHAWMKGGRNRAMRERERERGYTFLDPENPADSVKKYANGRRMKRHKLQPRNTSFHRPTFFYMRRLYYMHNLMYFEHIEACILGCRGNGLEPRPL